jgi:hypothetical protein
VFAGYSGSGAVKVFVFFRQNNNVSRSPGRGQAAVLVERVSNYYSFFGANFERRESEVLYLHE